MKCAADEYSQHGRGVPEATKGGLDISYGGAAHIILRFEMIISVSSEFQASTYDVLFSQHISKEALEGHQASHHPILRDHIPPSGWCQVGR